jgi:predicted nucleic acid-binding protein
MKGIADTGFLVAFLNRNDQYHEWAAEIGSRVSAPLLTCEAVLAETAYLIESTRKTLELLEQGFVDIAFELSKNIDEITWLAERYQVRKPDLADLCLIRMSEINPGLPVLTVDEADFRVYRRNKRDVIPIICPPQH